MARVRSPSYPSFGLQDAIEFARKIHEQDRQHPVSREDAAKHMGFSGLSGSSDRALSALMHYALADKVGKGEIRVSNLALSIIHPDSLKEKRDALRTAAFMPELFQGLRERYAGEPPSMPNLQSYLSRENFAPAAIAPAARAYLETCDYLKREGAYESDPQTGSGTAESSPSEPMEMRPMQPAPLPVVAPPAVVMAAPPPAALADLELNEPNLVIKSGTVRVEALLDFDGLAVLEEQLKALKMLMKPKAKSPAIVPTKEEAPQDEDDDVSK